MEEKKYYEHLCGCPCKGKIEIKPHHKYYGIPKYICGHYVKTKEGKERIKNKLIGRKQSKEAGRKRGKTLKKYYEEHPEVVERISKKVSKSLQGHVVTKETKEKQKNVKLGRKRGPHSVIHRKNLSISMQKSEKHKKACLLTSKLAKNPKYLENISGKNSSNWKGGITNQPYPFDFNEELKELIRKRDSYVCQLCGKTQEENKQRLTVHHVDYDKDNCDPNKNLISLCCSCNFKVNFNRKSWTRFFQLKLRIFCEEKDTIKNIKEA